MTKHTAKLGRRGFLSLLGIGAVVVATQAIPDPERLLWMPGKRLISIPSRITGNQLLPPRDITMQILRMLHDSRNTFTYHGGSGVRIGHTLNIRRPRSIGKPVYANA